MILNIFTEQTGNGTTPSVPVQIQRDSSDVVLSGTFGGATVQLQYAMLNDFTGSAVGSFINIGDPVTQESVQRIDIDSCLLRAVLTGATGTTNISCFLNYRR